MTQEPFKGRRLKSGLAMSAEDHWAIGSTPPNLILLEDPRKSFFELLGPEGVKAYILDQVNAAREMHALALAGQRWAIQGLPTILKMLWKNLLFLRRKKKLPPELEGLKLKDFQVSQD